MQPAVTVAVQSATTTSGPQSAAAMWGNRVMAGASTFLSALEQLLAAVPLSGTPSPGTAVAGATDTAADNAAVATPLLPSPATQPLQPALPADQPVIATRSDDSPPPSSAQLPGAAAVLPEAPEVAALVPEAAELVTPRAPASPSTGVRDPAPARRGAPKQPAVIPDATSKMPAAAVPLMPPVVAAQEPIEQSQPVPAATPPPKPAPAPAAVADQPPPVGGKQDTAKPTASFDAAAAPSAMPAAAAAPPVAAPIHAATEPAAPLVVQQPAPEPQAVRLAATDAPPAPSSHTGSPAAQIAPALVQVGHAADGATRLTVRLDPPELGQVQVRIERPPEAPARVEITVEKPETLTLLLRDQPQLQRALDQAGVPAEGRSVTFHLAAQEAAQRSEPATAPAAGVAAGGPSDDGSHGAPRNGGQPRRQTTGTPDLDPVELAAVAPSGWVRGGIDITA
jgi:hypothetical protein